MQASTGQIAAHTPLNPPEHYEPLRNAFPEWLGKASAARRQALKRNRRTLSGKLKKAPKAQHAELRALIAQRMSVQNDIDRTLEQLQDAYAYAEPILNQALKSRFSLDVDVRNTFLHLYIPVKTPGFPITTGSRSWTVSLLDAALHNFEENETEAGAYSSESTFTTRPSPSGQFETLPQIKARMSIAAFARLCRDLDIGGRYKTHLEKNLGIDDPVAGATLRQRINASEKAALQAALHMAKMNGDVSELYVRLIGGLLDDLQGMRVNGQALLCHDLSMMSSKLTGIVLFAPDLQQARTPVRVVAYVPDDPEHPVKEYASTADMMRELTRQLRNPEYQKFFSRFVAHDQRGYFFADLGQRLSRVKWHPTEPGSSLPAWRDTPVDKPNLQFAATPIEGSLLDQLYQRKLNKILNDAATIAVPTATVDRNARWAIWDSFTRIASSILEIASFVLMPFVPFLGEMMMAYITYQLLDELFTCYVDLAEGLTTEACEHYFAALESMIQLGAFGVGSGIAMAELPKVLPPEVVAFMDRFQPVKLRNGKTLYWKPDLKPYQRPFTPAADSSPDAQGLHLLDGKKLLPADQACYAVSDHEHPGKLRIEHPTHPDTYQPIVRHNGEGAFHTELENPLQWDRATALRRIGPRMEPFAPARRERILQVSGYTEDGLRKMHVNQERVPPLLADTIERFKIDQDLQTFIQQLSSDDPTEYRMADPLIQLQLLNEQGLWPANRRLRLLSARGETIWQSSSDAQLPLTDIHQGQLTDGDLLKTLLESLSEPEKNTLLDEEFGQMLALEARTRRLRARLARIADQQRPNLFEKRYQSLQHRDAPLVKQVARHVPQLPVRITEELIHTATGTELLQLAEGQFPQRQQDLSETATHELRITRAYEGLELDSVSNPDSDTLALHSLQQLPGWSTDVRLEVRAQSRAGRLLDSTGPMEAPIQKVLVLKSDGLWQPYDEQGLELLGLSDFYTAVLQALPDAQRQALNLQIGEGEKLRQAIRDNPLPRSELRLALLSDPVPAPAVDALRLLGTDGYSRNPPPPLQTPRTLENRIRQIYPRMSEADRLAMARRLENHPGGAIAELSRLQLEYAQLDSDLNQWTFDLPKINPVDGTRISDDQRMAAIRDRQMFAHALRICWRREMRGLNGYEMHFSQPIVGALPALTADFSHVVDLELVGSGGPGAVNAFLERFQGLVRMDLRHFDLHNLPPRLANLPHLKQLTLQHCGVVLTPENQSLLSSFNELTALSLSNNPLGTTVDFSTLPNLSHLDLSSTGISEVPPGLLSHPRLISVWLADNQITTLPEPFFEQPAATTAGYDFFGNPLSSATREKVKIYFNRTGSDLGIRPEQGDINRTKALFTDLNDRQSSELIYSLPGSLAQGRLQLERWESEIARLTTDLATWSRSTPNRNPVTGEMLTPDEHANQFFEREIFAGRIERLWRHRSTAHPLTRADTFSAQASFMGDMPTLMADFSHITAMSLNGNKQINATSAFFQSFPRLKRLILHDFALDQLPQTLTGLPALEILLLQNCGVTFTGELQIALASMHELESLELPGNPLVDAPDVGSLTQLTYLDLSRTGISQVPDGLPGHPRLRTAIVSDNRISELPEALFEMPASASEGFDFSGNPLSDDTLERIKRHSRETGVDFAVLAEPADIEAIQALFPGLDREEASDVFYGLPGDLEHGRRQLRHWKAELEQLTADLAQWKMAIPQTHPVTHHPFTPPEFLAEHSARTTFAERLQKLWRTRLPDNPRQRGDSMIASLTFSGELPGLTTDFSHIRALSLTGNPAVSNIDGFLQPFSTLRHLELHDFSLGQNPLTALHIPSLERLVLENCGLTLTPQSQANLSSLGSLQYLNLNRNPLGQSPTLKTLPALLRLLMTDSGISSLPDGLFDHPRLLAAFFDRNQIRELPDILFRIDARAPRQISLADNPLSSAMRERIKRCYRQFRLSFGVSMPQEDVERIRELFPSLDDEDANRVLYLLEGTLDDGRLQIEHWEAELRQLEEDLDQWVTDIPQRYPGSDLALTESDRAAEFASRTTFRLEIEAFWRQRSAVNPESRAAALNLNAEFIGELPALSADFAHVTTLSIIGNPQLRIGTEFLRGFTGLDSLELRDLALAEVPPALTGMPDLQQLVLSNCGVVLNDEGSVALHSLKQLLRLDLYNNPLGRSPDIRRLPSLEFLDLTSTGISALPQGLLDAPGLETAILSGNRLTELPAEIFDLPASITNGFDFGNNPLNALTRERIKTYFRGTGENLGVLAEPADIARVQTLYPALSDEQASAFLYHLEGSLADGRLELARREAELGQLLGDLAAWESEIPEHRSNGQPLTQDERLAEEQNRAQLREALLSCWRKTPVEGSDVGDHDFTFRLTIQGELPTLSADFGHVSDLYLANTHDESPRVGRFLEAFPNLVSIDIRGYGLTNIPEAIFRMKRLNTLSLPACDLTLSPRDVAGLANLDGLDLLHLHDNPLGLTPDLSNLQGLTDLDLSTTGIREIPKGVLENFNWMEVDLSGNEISEIPDELMEVPAHVGDRYDLRGNPFSARAMQRIRAYYQETGMTLNVDGVLEHPPVRSRPSVEIED
jgi:Leucine-rich repeat (LRR) protein